MSAITLALAGFGVWLLVEGALCAIAPEYMRRIGQLLSNMPARDLAIGGLVALGALLMLVRRTQSGLALVGVSAYIRVVRKRYRLAHAQRLAKIDARIRRARAPKDHGVLP